MAQDVGTVESIVVSFPSSLVGFWGFHPYMCFFSFRKLFCDLFLLLFFLFRGRCMIYNVRKYRTLPSNCCCSGVLKLDTKWPLWGQSLRRVFQWHMEWEELNNYRFLWPPLLVWWFLNEATVDSALVDALEQFEDQATNRLLLSAFWLVYYPLLLCCAWVFTSLQCRE